MVRITNEEIKRSKGPKRVNQVSLKRLTNYVHVKRVTNNGWIPKSYRLGKEVGLEDPGELER